MPLAKIVLTPEAAARTACQHCARRSELCHISCTNYAVDTILGIIGHVEHTMCQQLDIDMYHIERNRARRGLR